MTRAGLLLAALLAVACDPVVPAPDGGTTMTTMNADAGSLGPNLSCQATVVGATTGTFPCEVTATFARGAPNATTFTITGNARDKNPELNLSFKVALEPEPGRTYGWMNDVLTAELLANDAPAGNSFSASKGQQTDPATFSFRPQEVTGRLATANGGAQLRVTFQLEATLRPTPASPATTNARITISVAR